MFRSPDLKLLRFPDAGASAAGRTLRSHLDPSPNAPIKYVARSPCCDFIAFLKATNKRNCSCAVKAYAVAN